MRYLGGYSRGAGKNSCMDFTRYCGRGGLQIRGVSDYRSRVCAIILMPVKACLGRDQLPGCSSAADASMQ